MWDERIVNAYQIYWLYGQSFNSSENKSKTDNWQLISSYYIYIIKFLNACPGGRTMIWQIAKKDFLHANERSNHHANQNKTRSDATEESKRLSSKPRIKV